MKAWMRSASPTAIATVATNSTIDFSGDLPDLRREGAMSLEEAQPVRRPVGEESHADDPSVRKWPPVSTVLRIRAVVAHHVVVAARNLDRRREVARPVADAGDDVRVFLPDAVSDHVAVANRQPIPREPHDALDERLG